MQLHEISEHNTKIWVPDHVRSDFKVDWFQCKQSRVDSEVNDWQGGRQSVDKIKIDDRAMVLRHYCRGGLPARFSKDKFVFRGYKASRPYRELTLLVYMRDIGLPVPEPIAAKCIVKGFLYQADILMAEIVNSKTLAEAISKRKLQQETWLKVGNTIRQFHLQGIQHVDLNANNILLDEAGDVFLIDFDRCIHRSYSQTWAQAGLNRLKRSLDKIKEVNPKANFHQSDFDCLMHAYRA